MSFTDFEFSFLIQLSFYLFFYLFFLPRYYIGISWYFIYKMWLNKLHIWLMSKYLIIIIFNWLMVCSKSHYFSVLVCVVMFPNWLLRFSYCYLCCILYFVIIIFPPFIEVWNFLWISQKWELHQFVTSTSPRKSSWEKTHNLSILYCGLNCDWLKIRSIRPNVHNTTINATRLVANQLNLLIFWYFIREWKSRIESHTKRSVRHKFEINSKSRNSIKWNDNLSWNHCC